MSRLVRDLMGLRQMLSVQVELHVFREVQLVQSVSEFLKADFSGFKSWGKKDRKKQGVVHV